MRFGIFGDIHSNLEALEAVLEDMQAQAVTHTVCIGDIVGYNANPRECLEIVRALGCPIVKGNHDEEASEGREVEHFNDMALSAIRYTRSQLTKDQPNRWGYVFSCLEAESSFQYQKTNICFFGHTHVPHVFIRDTKVHEFFYKKIDIQPEKKYFVNVGSVGQPRDGDWRSAYVIYDSGANTIELRRLPYDVWPSGWRMRCDELKHFQ
jgi:predicted phosphodiesterase